MLICPQCQVENRQENKFCQGCGTSLTHKNCPECGASVAWGVQTCAECGAFTGIKRWAIISDVTSVQTLEAASQAEASIQAGTYLDAQKRYRVLEVKEKLAVPGEEGRHWLQVLVVDEQPLIQPEAQVRLSKGDEDKTLPIAIPYLQLQDLFYLVLPLVYDVWEEGTQQILILEDRSEWDLVTEVLIQEDLPLIQILHWLDEMLLLWQPLAEMGYSQSLGVKANLRLDEDQSLCLQQVYPDLLDGVLSLADLAQLWQQYLEQLELKSWLEGMIAGEITEVNEARSRLAKIAETQAEWEIETGNSGDDFQSNMATDLDEATVLLPMQIFSLMDAGVTNVGRQRHHNEDYYAIQTYINKQETVLGQNFSAKGLYIVCDGMGGHAAGEVASAMTTESLLRYFQSCWHEQLPNREQIREGIFLANQEVHEVNQENASSGSGRMGTTLVMVLVQDTKIAIAHVGDSRIYSYTRKKGLQQITIDHEVGQREIQRGVEPELAYGRADAYQLTQAIGPRDNSYIYPDINFLEINEDMVLLLCSDGLSDNDLLENNTDLYVAPLISSKANLEKGVETLIDFANEYNGHDNITAVVVQIKVRPNLGDSVRSLI